MKKVVVKSSHMMSLICATGVNQTWRSQPNLCMEIPYCEWFKFIDENSKLLAGRQPFDYEVLKASGKSINWYKVYLGDIIRSQYNELAISSNRRKDATLIIPSADGGDLLTFEECVAESKKLDVDAFNKAQYRFSVYSPEPPMLVTEGLSQWNFSVFLYLVYIQHLAIIRTGESAKIKIGW